MNIVDLLNPHLLERPNAAVLIDHRGGHDRSITFAQLQEQSLSVARQLTRSGLAPGSKILMLAPVSIELYVLLLGIFRAEMIAVLPDPSADIDWVNGMCAKYLPDAVIFSKKTWFMRWLSSELRHLPRQFSYEVTLPRTQLLTIALDRQATGRRCGRTGNDSTKCRSSSPKENNGDRESDGASDDIDEVPALLSFTSGSTGERKAILRTQRFLNAQLLAVASCTRPEPGQVQLCSLPVFVLGNIAHGVTTVLPDANLRHPGKINATRVVRQIRKFGCREILASPAFAECLMDHCIASEDTLPGVKSVFTGGAPVFGEFIKKTRLAFPCAELEIVYGSTEAEPISHISLKDIAEDDYLQMERGAGLLAGYPAQRLQVSIICEKFVSDGGIAEADFLHNKIAEPGIPGQIFVEGDHVVKAYLGGEASSEKVRVGNSVWHRTGDSGYLDTKGRLWLLGRSGARVESDGTTLYPFAIENVAVMKPGVKRAALIRDNRQRRILVIECNTPGRAKVREHLKDVVQQFDVHRLVFVSRIPVDKRHNSKVDYPALQRMLPVDLSN